MKHSMKRRKSNKSKKGGGCGCSSSTSTQPSGFFSGGKKRKSRKRVKGGDALGPASLTNYDPSNTYTYALKDESLSPLNPNQITDSRGLPNSSFSGGRKKRETKKRGYKKRGGGTDAVLQNHSANSITNFASNTVSGALTGAHVVRGELIPNSSYTFLDGPKPFL